MTASPQRDRVRFLDYKGLRVVLLDFEGITEVADGLAAAEEAKAFVAKLPMDGSHCTMTDVRNTRYNKLIVEAFKELTVHNRPYMCAAAVVSDSTFHRAAIAMVAMFSRRKIGVFPSRQEALDYLAAEVAKR
jgi:hypothetical protein